MANINGNNSNNNLVGTAEDDVINGRGGADSMTGGAGDDIYIVENVGDMVIEAANEGEDLVRASINYALASNIENLRLTGTANLSGTGNGLDNTITGNDGDNTLNGGLGNDRLNGGLGADTLIGGEGNDTYVFRGDSGAADVIIEAENEGIDTVITDEVTHVLAENVENLTFLDFDAVRFGTGNDLDNVMRAASTNTTLEGLGGNDRLIGGTGNDTLIGGQGNDFLNGGLGADTLLGGEGDDIYVVDDAGDVVVEIDTVSTVATANTDVVGNVGLDSFTADNANSPFVASSSNGRYIVFNSEYDSFVTGDTNTLQDVFLKDMQTGSITRIYEAASSTDIISNLAISRNGNFVAVSHYNANTSIGEVLLIDVATGQSVAHNFFATAVSDDGRYLSGTDISSGLPGAFDTNLGIATTFSNSNNSNASYDDFDNISADGTKLVYRTNQSDLFYYDAITGTDSLIFTIDRPVSNGLPDAGVIDISADGNIFLFTTNVLSEGTGGWGIYTKNMISGQINEIVNPSELVYPYLGVGKASLSDDGRFVLYDIGFEGNFILKDMQTGASSEVALQGYALGEYVSLSSDGSQIVYLANEGLTKVLTIGAVDQGIDTVRSSIDYALTDNVENLILTGTANLSGTGNGLDNTITGNDGDNTLNGGLGNDRLNGGLGADTLIGGEGNDTYVFRGDSGASDVIIEAENEGIDTVITDEVTHVLAENVENLTFLDFDAVRFGTGNDLDNVMRAASTNTTLEGLGGNDRLIGGTGNDTLIGGQGNDFLNGGLGADTFRWALADKGIVGASARDMIADFETAPSALGGDVLDLRDLLTGEETGNLTSYIHFESVGANTVLHVSDNGGYSNGYSPTKDVQRITLAGVDLVTGFADDQAIIQNLLTNNKLITD